MCAFEQSEKGMEFIMGILTYVSNAFNEGEVKETTPATVTGLYNNVVAKTVGFNVKAYKKEKEHPNDGTPTVSAADIIQAMKDDKRTVEEENVQFYQSSNSTGEVVDNFDNNGNNETGEYLPPEESPYQVNNPNLLKNPMLWGAQPTEMKNYKSGTANYQSDYQDE